MAPAANSQNTSNTLHAPFPRISTTSHPLSSSSPANANRRPATAAPNSAPNPRSSAPRGGNIAGSMGPAPAAGAGRRNERFDRLFYTSPLPRSISREYHNLRASQGSAAGGATPAAATASAAVATTDMTTVSKTTATNTISVPSALRRSINANGTTSTTNRAEPGTIRPSPFRSSPRNAALARLNGATPAKAGAAAATTDSDDPLSAPNASSISLPSPSRTITRPTKPPPGALQTTKPPVPTKSFTVEIVEDVPMRIDSNSDDEAQDVDGNNKETTEEEQPVRPTSPLRTKRARSPFRAPIPPKKIARMAAAASPGGARVMRSMRKPTQTPPASTKATPENEIAPRRSSLRHNQHNSDTTLHSLAAVPVAAAPQPPSAPVAKPPASTKDRKRILPGFYIPPGILGKTGSLWDGGRRASRRISLPPGGITPIPPSPRVQRAARGRRESLDVGETKVEKSVRKGISEDGHERISSTAVEPTPEQRGELGKDESEDSPGVEQRNDPSPDEYVEERQENTSPPPQPQPQQPQPQQLRVVRKVRKVRKSIGGKVKRFSTNAKNAEPEPDVLVPGKIGARVRMRSILGASVFDPAPSTKSGGGSSGGAKEPRKDERKEAQNTQPGHGQASRERETPSSRKPQQLRTKRSLRSSNGDEGRMDRVLSAGIEDPTTPAPTKKAAKKIPAQKKGGDWVVEETPPQAPTTSPATAETDKKETAKKGRKGGLVVDETPQQAVEKRVTRGSVSAGKKKSTRVGVGLKRGPNAEFEFSDDE